MSRAQRVLEDQAWRALADQLATRQRLFGRLSLDGMGLATAYYLDEELVALPAPRPLRRNGRRRRSLSRDT